MNILWQGARGPQVKSLQMRLKDLGFDPGPADEVFGPLTAQAVARFQKERRLDADGIAGPQTLDALSLPAIRPRTATPVRDKVFVSYSHQDRRWLEMLQIHLAPLKRQGVIQLWDDTCIKPGSNWRDEIANALASARVGILLVSAYFMASEFIASNELLPLLEAAKKDGALVLPVIISPCVMGDLAEFQSVNPPSKPLVDLDRGDRDRVWVKVVTAITGALNA
jgi:hypothetical protein